MLCVPDASTAFALQVRRTDLCLKQKNNVINSYNDDPRKSSVFFSLGKLLFLIQSGATARIEIEKEASKRVRLTTVRRTLLPSIQYKQTEEEKDMAWQSKKKAICTAKQEKAICTARREIAICTA